MVFLPAIPIHSPYTEGASNHCPMGGRHDEGLLVTLLGDVSFNTWYLQHSPWNEEIWGGSAGKYRKITAGEEKRGKHKIVLLSWEKLAFLLACILVRPVRGRRRGYSGGEWIPVHHSITWLPREQRSTDNWGRSRVEHDCHNLRMPLPSHFYLKIKSRREFWWKHRSKWKPLIWYIVFGRSTPIGKTYSS